MAIDKRWQIKSNKDKALMLAQREIAVLVCDAVELEGIHFTLPEIQTLLDGITVGGHRLGDQQIAINQGDAWRSLFAVIKEGTFQLSSDYACQLHGIAAKEDALEWGKFRSGGVTIAGTQYMPPIADALPGLFERMTAEMLLFDDIYDQAIFIFLTMARCQFFYDVNKRMGRFMMNGLLLNAGYPAINLPARRQLEFNQLMLDFYASGNLDPMNRFMRSCLDKRIIKIMRE
ncbi:MAG: Fic family protein [Gammaproteobacteria bacterium]|nr:Fic family protein [Gammaproteobacteria bacterium]